ncbi:MAG: hypothetical protein IPL52_05420 [Flavobacteriales bacterium]|nr:hypothetical protein [Flavobacteriales bacterium]
MDECDQMDAATWQMPPYLTGFEVDNTPVLSLPDVTNVLGLLVLTNCGLTASPVAYSDNVQVIDLSGNPITSWAPWSAELHTLRLNDCGLTDLPPAIPDTIAHRPGSTTT